LGRALFVRSFVKYGRIRRYPVMLFGFLIWLWLLVVGFFFFILPALVGVTFRRNVRRELVECIRKSFPTVTMVQQTDQALHLRTEDGTAAQLNLHNLYKTVAALRPHTKASRHDAFARFTAPLNNASDNENVTLESHGSRILPRIVD